MTGAVLVGTGEASQLAKEVDVDKQGPELALFNPVIATHVALQRSLQCAARQREREKGFVYVCVFVFVCVCVCVWVKANEGKGEG